MNILDLAENSVKAKSSLVTIVVDYRDNGMLFLTIEDDGSGMTKETAKRVADPFYTSRTTRKVGLGIPFVKMLAEMTGGGMTVESELGKGTLVTASFLVDHIDMIPLGDMGSTMSVLVSANPLIDFIYRLRRNGREFSLDSREMKQILDGVPVSSPEVAVFIREYVEENTRQILTA